MKNEESIRYRFKIGYTMSVYGDRNEIHNQMNKDIETLLDIIKNKEL
jgi:hypothetical protein